MTRIVYSLPYLFTLFFISLSVGRLDFPVLLDESIYVFPTILEVSWLDFIPGVSQSDPFYGHPSGYPLLLRVLLELSGGSLILPRLFTLLASATLLISVFKLIKEFSNETSALFTLILIGSNQLFITESVMLHPDMFFILFGLLSWLCYLKERAILSILFSFLAIYMRESAMAFIIPVLFHSFFNRNLKLFYKKVWIGNLINIILLISFFGIHKYAYGTFFGNLEMMGRSDQGFSFFSLNESKWENHKLNWFMIRSFATSIPFFIIIYTLLYPLHSLLRLKVPNFFAYLIFGISLSLFLTIALTHSDMAFRIHHTMVNINTFFKLIVALIVLKLMDSIEFTETNRDGQRPESLFALFTGILFFGFYFFYEDTSPRDMTVLIVLYFSLGMTWISRIVTTAKKTLLFSIIILVFQLIWLKIPQVPRAHTHPKLHKDLVTSLKNVNQLAKANGKKLYSSPKIGELLNWPLYGWNERPAFTLVNQYNEAEIIIKSNYYPRYEGLDESIEQNKANLNLLQKISDHDFELVIYQKSTE